MAAIRRLVAAAALLTAALAPLRGAAANLEYPVKATYLYKFVPFVEWPPGALPAADQPVVLCVPAADPFGPVLDQATLGQKIGGHRIVVRRLGGAEKALGCHVLYLAGLHGPAAAEALQGVRGAPVLTVTDQAGDAPAGIITFVVRDNRVRFIINPQAAAESGLSISSKLLSLALDVRSGR
ncbi:MAG: YfiR family protein [Pseudomonadota bacterium]